ncbi:hypothetical protein D3C71_2015220 [compost metagenome]
MVHSADEILEADGHVYGIDFSRPYDAVSYYINEEFHSLGRSRRGDRIREDRWGQ